METQASPKPIKEILPEVLNQITQKASEESTCCVCGRVCTGDPSINSASWKCAECEEQYLNDCEDVIRGKKATRTLRMLEMVPTLFRNTDKSKLPQPEKLVSALNWKFGPKGLLLHGLTGAGKSRIIWEVAKREIRNGRKLRSLAIHELFSYPGMVMANDGSAEAFSKELIEVELLLLDDPFKSKPTERVEELLFAVIDERGMWERPCLVTLNDTGETLAARLSTDRGPALIRRLREYCQAIQF